MADIYDPSKQKKRCGNCDEPLRWNQWYCHKCGERAVLDTPEGFQAEKGKNRTATIINDRKEDLVLHVVPYETVRMKPGQIVMIPIAQDEPTLFRVQADGSIKVCARVYAESAEQTKKFLAGA